MSGRIRSWCVVGTLLWGGCIADAGAPPPDLRATEQALTVRRSATDVATSPPVRRASVTPITSARPPGEKVESRQRVAAPTPSRTPPSRSELTAGRAPQDPNEGGFSLGFQDSLYTDSSPICHYLERGINDFGAGHTDRYVLAPPTVSSLEHIDHIGLGLDLPYTHCQDNPRSVPCVDEDYTLRWCVQRVALSVLGITLYDEEVDSGCMELVRSGLDGMRSISSSELRNNPNWGFSVEELEQLFEFITVNPDGSFGFEYPGIRFGAEYLSRTLEGVVGHFLADSNKGCANSQYCDNKRGFVTFWSSPDDTDCDMGGCPSKSSRRASPWVELKGYNNRVHVDFDVELNKGLRAPGDCIHDGLVPRWCGTRYDERIDGSMELDLVFPCEAQALRFELEGGQYTLPLCDSVSDSFKGACASVVPHFIAPKAEVECFDHSWEHCGKTGTLDRSLYRQQLRAKNAEFDSEGGPLHHLANLGCGLLGPLAMGAGCNPDDIATGMLLESLDVSLMDETLFSGLRGCPAVGIDPDGSVAFDLQNLETCPEGSPDPHCQPGGNLQGNTGLGGDSEEEDEPGFGLLNSVAFAGGQGSAPKGLKRTRQQPAMAMNFTAVTARPGGMPVAGLLDMVRFVRARNNRPGTPARDLKRFAAGSVASRGPTSVGNLIAPATPLRNDQKIPMRELDDALVAVCAASLNCAPGVDPSALPLAELAGTNLPALMGQVGGIIAQCDGLEGVDYITCMNDAADQIDTLLGFLIYNDEFRTQCVGHHFPDAAENHDGGVLQRLAYLQAVADWFDEHFTPDYEATGDGSCNARPGLEELFPVPGLELTLKTRDAVADNFSFVNFRKNSDVSQRLRDVYGCHHLRSESLPPSEAPRCGDNSKISKGPDGSVGEDCGTIVGGPCADMTADSYHHVLAFGTDPEDPAWHPNGDYAWSARCGHDLDTGEQLVCVEGYFPGAGTNHAGVCKRCGVPGDGENPDDFTMIGCEPEGHSCPQDLFLGADGRCWDLFEGVPEWECEADCKGLYNDYGYCVHHMPWRWLMQGEHPEFYEYDQTYSEPICAEFMSCRDSGAECASQGKACAPDTETCVWECWSDADCWSHDPPPAYPNGFHCDTDTHTCRLSY